MDISSEEWGGLREDVGYIKAKVAMIDDHDRRIASLEEDKAGRSAVRGEQADRRNIGLRVRSNLISATSAALAAVAVVLGSSHLK